MFYLELKMCALVKNLTLEVINLLKITMSTFGI